MYVCNVSIASLIRSLKENASEFVEKYKMINADNIVIGKPNEKRFKVGDWIIVEEIIEGIVERIGFRSTVVRKFDKSIAIIPNFQFAENAVINISETTTHENINKIPN